jgi:proteic killer suppression protein
MIRSFKSKPLADLFSTGRSAKIDVKMWKRILVRLDRPDGAEKPEDMNFPGFNVHALHGFMPMRYPVDVSGSRCITFEFEDENPHALIGSSIISNGMGTLTVSRDGADPGLRAVFKHTDTLWSALRRAEQYLGLPERLVRQNVPQPGRHHAGRQHR